MNKVRFATSTDWATGDVVELAYLEMNCPHCERHVRFAVRRDDPLTMADEISAMKARYERLVDHARKQKERLDSCLKILADL